MHELNHLEFITSIFSTHDPKIIKKADRIFYIEDGLIVGEDEQ